MVASFTNESMNHSSINPAINPSMNAFIPLKQGPTKRPLLVINNCDASKSFNQLNHTSHKKKGYFRVCCESNVSHFTFQKLWVNVSHLHFIKQKKTTQKRSIYGGWLFVLKKKNAPRLFTKVPRRDFCRGTQTHPNFGPWMNSSSGALLVVGKKEGHFYQLR